MLPVVFLATDFPGIPLGLVDENVPVFRTIVLPAGGTLIERLESVVPAEKFAVRALVCLLTDRLDEATLTTLKKKLPSLSLIANYAVGYNNIDVSAAHALGVAVTNTPNVLGDATADLTLLLMLMVARNVFPYAVALQTQGSFPGWSPHYGLGVDLAGRTLGIVGLGDIGRRVAMRARVLGMNVIALESVQAPPSLSSKKETAEQRDSHSIERVAEAEFLARTDVLSLHCPLTPQTRTWLNAQRLAALKKGAIVVNTARGEIVDEKALALALRSGHLFGAGLDVFCGEPQLSDELRNAPHLVVLPHLGSATIETRAAMGKRVLENLFALFAGKTPLPHQIRVS